MALSRDDRLFANPFSRDYWRAALQDFRKTRVLVFAAVMIALRVALKPVSIPVGMDLRINTAFFINAVGAMVFGPVVAIVSAAISDTLGCILFPQGVYFFPFIFVEIAGSLIFSLFLYRTEVTAKRVILARFCIDFFVNIVLNTPIMYLYYWLVMGKYYTIVDLPRFAKNLVMFPIESVLLILFLRAVIPPLRSLNYVYSGVEKLRLTRKMIALLAILLAAGVAATGGYLVYSYNNTSLSAGYTASERLEKNNTINEIVRERHPELADTTTVTIIESAYPRFLSDEVTCYAAVYEVDEQMFAENAAAFEPSDSMKQYDLTTLQGYSRSKAKNDTSLKSIGSAVIKLSGKTGEVLSYEDNLDTRE